MKHKGDAGKHGSGIVVTAEKSIEGKK